MKQTNKKKTSRKLYSVNVNYNNDYPSSYPSCPVQEISNFVFGSEVACLSHFAKNKIFPCDHKLRIYGTKKFQIEITLRERQTFRWNTINIKKHKLI